MSRVLISRFRDTYDFLANPYRCQVVYRCGMSTYPYDSSERAFQAQKATKPADLQRIIEARTPLDSKRAAHLIRWEPGQQEIWDQSRKRIMLEVVLAKFTQNEDLRRALVATRDALLIEGNTWGDDFWGCVPSERRSMLMGKPFWGPGREWFGENYLGQILMAVRMVLR